MVIELGEVRQGLEDNEAKVLESIIETNSQKDSYFILKHSNWEGMYSNVLRTRYSLRSRKPKIPIIGTKLWLVDNREGTLTLEWDLPMDIIGIEPFVDQDNIVKNNFNSANQYGFAIHNA